MKLKNPTQCTSKYADIESSCRLNVITKVHCQVPLNPLKHALYILHAKKKHISDAGAAAAAKQHTNCLHLSHFSFSVIAIAKINLIQSHVSVVVYQIRKFVSSIWAERRLTSKISHYVCIWCQMNMNN